MKKLHKGKMEDCKVCTPEQKPKRMRRGFEPKVVRKIAGLEGNIRRQMSEEIGEDELSKDFRFGLLQKYGLIAPRIDRRVTKPSWMEESTWKTLRQQFHNATKGLVPEHSRFNSATRPQQNRPQQNSQQRANRYNPRHQRNSRPTSAPQD